MKTENFNKMIDFLKKQDSEIDLSYFFNEDITSFDEYSEAIEYGGGFNIEIIYYSNAIDYLKENDPSLKDCLRLASEMGFSPENLSSEILASLLASQLERENFEDIEDEFTELLNEILEDEQNNEEEEEEEE